MPMTIKKAIIGSLPAILSAEMSYKSPDLLLSQEVQTHQ